MTVAKGIEWYLYPAHGGTVMGPWPCWATRKWNSQQAHKGLFFSKVCTTWAILGVSGQNIKRKTKCWVDNQHLVMWHSLSSTQKQARKLISSPSLNTKTRFLSFNRTQSRVVILFKVFMFTRWKSSWREKDLRIWQTFELITNFGGRHQETGVTEILTAVWEGLGTVYKLWWGLLFEVNHINALLHSA